MPPRKPTIDLRTLLVLRKEQEIMGRLRRVAKEIDRRVDRLISDQRDRPNDR